MGFGLGRKMEICMRIRAHAPVNTIWQRADAKTSMFTIFDKVFFHHQYLFLFDENYKHGGIYYLLLILLRNDYEL